MLKHCLQKHSTPLPKGRGKSCVAAWGWGFLFLLVTLVKIIPGLGSVYTFHIYPTIARLLSPIPNIIPFAVGDLFIAASIAWVIAYPIYSIAIKKKKKLPTLLRVTEYLLWVYVWFYAAWGLNYSQPNIYSRLRMRPVEVQDSTFRTFAYRYADSLNTAYQTASSLSNISYIIASSLSNVAEVTRQFLFGLNFSF